MTHTEGPWKSEAGTVKAFGRGVIATCPSPQNDGVMEFIANAHLIASAPDMLAVLKDVLPTIEELAKTRGLSFSEAGGLAEDIRAAISKAEGK